MNNINSNLQQQPQSCNNVVPQLNSASNEGNQEDLIQRNLNLENLLKEKNIEVETTREIVKWFQRNTVRKGDYDVVLKQNETITRKNDKLKSENDTLRSSLAECKRDLQSVNDILAAKNQEHLQFKTQMETLNTHCENLVSENEKLNKTIENLQTQVTTLDSSSGALQANLDALLVENRKLEGTLFSRSRAKVEELQKKLKEAEIQIHNLKCGWKFSSDQVIHLTSEKDSLLQKLESIEEKFTKLQTSFKRTRETATERGKEIQKLLFRMIAKRVRKGKFPSEEDILRLSSRAQGRIFQIYVGEL